MTSRLPPLSALRAFESAARHLSFKLAAAELHVTPGAVSQQIKSLEDFLGVPLFRRLTRALALSPEGQAMLPKLREGLDCLAAALDQARQPVRAGILTVCAPPSFTSRWLIPRLSSFASLHPEVDLRVSGSVEAIDRRDGRAPRAADGSGADLVIRFGRGDYPDCRVDRLFSPVYVAVCSPALLRGPRPLRSPADLRWQRLIHDDTIPDLEARPGWDQWLELAGVGDLELTHGVRFGNASLALDAAIAGQGVVLAARALVSAEISAGRLVMPFEIAIPSRFAYYATTARALAERPAVAAFRDWLITEAAAENAAAPA